MSTINFISVHKQVLAIFQMVYHTSTRSIIQQFDLVILNERNQNFNSLVDTKRTEGGITVNPDNATAQATPADYDRASPVLVNIRCSDIICILKDSL